MDNLLSGSQLRELQDLYFDYMSLKYGLVDADAWFEHNPVAAIQLCDLGLYERHSTIKQRRFTMTAKGLELADKLFRDDFEKKLKQARFIVHMRRLALSDQTRVEAAVKEICKDIFTQTDNYLAVNYSVNLSCWQIEIFSDFDLIVSGKEGRYSVKPSKFTEVFTPEGAAKLSQLIGVGLQVVEFLNADYQRALDQFQAK